MTFFADGRSSAAGCQTRRQKAAPMGRRWPASKLSCRTYQMSSLRLWRALGDWEHNYGLVAGPFCFRGRTNRCWHWHIPDHFVPDRFARRVRLGHMHRQPWRLRQLSLQLEQVIHASCQFSKRCVDSAHRNYRADGDYRIFNFDVCLHAERVSNGNQPSLNFSAQNVTRRFYRSVGRPQCPINRPFSRDIVTLIEIRHETPQHFSAICLHYWPYASDKVRRRYRLNREEVTRFCLPHCAVTTRFAWLPSGVSDGAFASKL